MTTPATPPAGTPHPEPQGDAGEPTPTSEGKGNRREANLRKRAQVAETERDSLRTQFDTTRRAIVDSIAVSQGLSPKLLEAVDLADLIDDEGRVDGKRVTEALAVQAQAFGISRRPPVQPNPQQGAGGSRPSGKVTWSEALGRK